MTVVRKYAGAVHSNPDSWANPTYALGDDDDLCATKAFLGTGHAYMFLDEFGFDIPAGSTINSVELGLKGGQQVGVYDLVYFEWFISMYSYAVDAGGLSYANCASTSWRSVKYTSDSYTMPTVDEINGIEGDSGASYTRLTYVKGESYLNVGYCDAVYIEIDYTAPSAAAIPLGDGIVFVGCLFLFFLLFGLNFSFKLLPFFSLFYPLNI